MGIDRPSGPYLAFLVCLGGPFRGCLDGNPSLKIISGHVGEACPSAIVGEALKGTPGVLLMHWRCQSAALAGEALDVGGEVIIDRIVQPVGGVGFPAGHDAGLDALDTPLLIGEELPCGRFVPASSRDRANASISVAEPGVIAPRFDLDDLAAVGEGADQRND